MKEEKLIRGDTPVKCVICGKKTAPIYLQDRGPFCSTHYFEALDAGKTKY